MKIKYNDKYYNAPIENYGMITLEILFTVLVASFRKGIIELEKVKKRATKLPTKRETHLLCAERLKHLL